MKFLAGLVAGAALVVSAVAQAGIAFTSTPAVAVTGQQYTLTWGGGDDSKAATLTLRKGNPQNLQTVATLTSSATGGSYVWTPASSLASGTDYALQITQGQSDINYSGPFTIVGGTGSSSISFSGTSTSTLTSTLTSNSTVTSLVSLIGSSIGTGVPVSRNTTFSSQTLTSTTTTSATTRRSTTTTASATDTSATTAPTGGAAQLASSFALVLGAVAAIVCVN